MLSLILSNIYWLGVVEKEVVEDPWGRLGSVLGWVFSGLGAIAIVGSALWTRRTGKETVAVNEKDAGTRAVAQVIEALTEGLNELRLELKEEKAANLESRMKITCLEEEVAELRGEREAMKNERFEMIEHIEYLESVIPVPPGPPARPKPWDYLSPK